MKKFVKIVSNCHMNREKGEDDFLYAPEMASYELIPTENLIKIYRYHPTKQHILVYVHICPETGLKREFHEMFRTEQVMLDRLSELERILS